MTNMVVDVPYKLRKKNLTLMAVHSDTVQETSKQLTAAVQYCKDNNCKGYKALATKQFPLIKSPLTVNHHLAGKVSEGRADIATISAAEEKLLADFMINKARAFQPLSRKDANQFIWTMLQVRNTINQKNKGRRRVEPLSRAGYKVMQTKKAGRKFWQRFDTKYRSQLKKKRRGVTSIKRATSCTEVMAIEHIDELADELVRLGIFTSAKKVGPGKWAGQIDGKRIYNRDETPQFINYGIDGSSRNLYYCGKGEQCQGLINENRECVSIEPFISLDGNICMAHVIFAGSGIKSNMAPQSAVEAIPNLLISTTDHGMQTGKSCLQSYKEFNNYLIEKQIKKPVVMLTDGHASRFDLEVLQFCNEHKIYQFVSPADTTGKPS